MDLFRFTENPEFPVFLRGGYDLTDLTDLPNRPNLSAMRSFHRDESLHGAAIGQKKKMMQVCNGYCQNE